MTAAKSSETKRAQHTPGPWTAELEWRPEGNGGHEVYCVRAAKRGATRTRIVDLDGRDDADARLIAQAPAMYDLIQKLAAWHLVDDDGEEAAVAAARAILAAIDGSES
jgi:hypothetical protein